jgi:hypothetical protein
VRLGLNKVGELRREPVLRNIFGQEHNKLDIAPSSATAAS